ncbi:cytochrome b/b6 domain-containing protein [Streptomyces sp. DH24]|uniref:cytochrome b/b6 domain-containing protein n=1 Tax=Streptomyces sp. DH24 TaxID=3040123 RepID=UPI002442271D|nr:cytochrome b/b6 domain-containing protein [Streptomyces sp. DH24]MDG9719157.1 cytochrome b/b6 domain-containing protein [Streptomyces sp. DH24]
MNPRSSHRSLPRSGRSAYGTASAVVLLLTPVIVLAGGDGVREFLNFGAGVLSLVSLSCSVVWGLVAQDRIFLDARQRIIGQAVHRTTAVASIAFLLLHVFTKIALDHTEPIAAVLPFALGVTGSEGLIGLGSAAGLLMVFVGVTGALRSAFASPAPVAARWRAMHMLAYPAWCAALVHGLYAGRAAKPVFVFLYGLCVLGVLAALALRAAPRPVKRRVADRIAEFLSGGEQSAREDREDREDLDASRARAAEPALPGYAPTARARTGASYAARAQGGYDTAGREPVNGFAAAYRAVSSSARGQRRQPFAAERTTRVDVPPDPRPAEAMPYADSGTSASGNWPVPSPPPVGEAPPSSYDPLNDTGHTIPAYDNPGAAGHGPSDVYDTGETNTRYGTYYPDDTYNSGPATETLPGASYDFGAPGPGEPWNTPSGGNE